MTLVEQCKLLEELLEAEHLTHLFQTVLIMGDARLGMEGVDKRVGDRFITRAAHKRFQLAGLKYRVGARSLFEDVVNLTQQQGLVGNVGQFVHDKVLLGLAL